MHLKSLFVSVFLLGLIACHKGDNFIDAERRFEGFESAPAFSLQGTPKEINKLIVNFFAPDCPPCEKEIPALKKFYEKHQSASNIRFVAIGSSLKAIDQNPKPGAEPPLTREQIKAEVSLFGKKFPQPYPRNLAAAEDLAAWRVTGFPETFVFIRSAGRLEFRKKIISEVTLEDLEREIQAL